MTYYSLNYIISEFADGKTIEKLNKDAAKIIKDEGGKILQTKELGRKKLAYQIGKNEFGTYFSFVFSAPKENIQKINHKLHSIEEFIRILIAKTKKPEKKKEIRKIEKLKVPRHSNNIMKSGSRSLLKAKHREKVESGKKEEKKIEIKKKIIPKPTAIKPKKAEQLISEIEQEKDTMKKLDQKLEEILKE